MSYKAEPRTYKFKVPPTGSMRFAFGGANVTNAVLMCNNSVISELTFEMPECAEIPEKVPLDFLGGAMFHAGLVQGLETIVVLTVERDEYPTFMFSAEGSLGWAEVGKSYYTEDVTAYSKGQPRELTIVYTPDFVGFKRR